MKKKLIALIPIILVSLMSCKDMPGAKREKPNYDFSLSDGESYFAGTDGSFNYRKQIEIEHLTGAVYPQPVLAYNSGYKNGMLGLGWKLEGLPLITRDTTYPLNYDGSDHYTGPNGGRLVKITGTENIYHYMEETFAEFEMTGGRGGNCDEPLAWTETQPDGTRYFYGTTENSRAMAYDAEDNSKGIRAWALYRVEDTGGNYYTVTYRHDRGEIYPERIVYAPAPLEGETLPRFQAVSFTYEDGRPDAPLSYRYHTQVSTALRLTGISVKNNLGSDPNDVLAGDTVLAYSIAYLDESVSSKSMIASISADNVTTGEQFSRTFDWQGIGTGTGNAVAANSTSASLPATFLVFLIFFHTSGLILHLLIANNDQRRSKMKLLTNFLFSVIIAPVVLGCLLSNMLFAAQGQSHSVGPDGSFNYRVDIEVPPGTRGIEPKLALVYNSNAENGLLGVGWQLEGLPVITRDTRYGIYYLGSDEYTGAGGHLVLTGDGYYHYETEAFSRLQAVDTQGDGPSYWIETKADGTKYYYGYEGNSQVQADRVYESNGQNCVHTWALSRVEDVHGNYYTVEYTVDNGKHYPEKIVYTQGNGVSTYRKVEFEYDDTREDVQTSFALGSEIVTAKRLSAIKTYYDVSDYIVFETGELVLNYQIVYQEDPEDITKKSKIINIKETANNLNKSVSFIWDNINNITYDTSINIGAYSNSNGQLMFYDIDGDGKSDQIFWNKYNDGDSNTIYAYLSIGDGSFGDPIELASPSNAYGQLLFHDLNGDGMADRIFWNKGDSRDGRIYTYLSNGDGSFGNYILAGTRSNSNGQLMFYDIDGDGKSDQIFWNKYNDGDSNTIYAYLSIGDGSFGDPIELASPSNAYGQLLFHDLNGDGMADRIFWNKGDSRDGRIYTYLSNGDGSFGNYILAGTRSNSNGQLMFYDINGDGKSDQIFWNKYNDGDSNTIYAYLSIGDGTFGDPIELASPSNIYGQLLFHDLNGDGMADRIFWNKGDNRDGRVYIYLSNGDGTFGNYILAGSHSNSNGQLMFYDINGDLNQDRIFWNKTDNGDGNIYSYESLNKTNTITSIINDENKEVIIDYRPIYKLTNAINPTSSTYPTITNKTPRYLTTKVTVGDGRDNEYSTSYEYEDGKLFMGRPWERKDLGFKTVTETEDATGIKKVTRYRHDDDNPFLAVKPELVEEYAGNGTLMRKTSYTYYDGDGETDTTYSYTDHDGNTAYTQLVKQKSETTETYNMDTLISTTTKNMSNYDNFGNAGTIETTCDDTTVHNTTTTITYENDETNWVLKRPSEIAVSLTGGSLVSKKRFVYTNNNLTTKGEYLDEESRWLDTTYEYDAAGNVTASVGPAGSREEFTYDSEYNTFIAAATSVSAAGNLTRSFEFDPRTGLKLSETDCNGYMQRFEYDGFGRVVAKYETIDSEELLTFEASYVQDETTGLLQTDRIVHVYDSAGDKISKNDSSLFYDGLNRVYREVYRLYDSTEAQIDRVTAITYNSAGTIAGKSEYVTRDEQGEYDKRETLYEYDSANRPSLITMPNSSQKTFSYSVLNSKYRVTTTHKGKTEQFVYNAQKQIITKTEADGSVIQYSYHPNGEPETITGPDGLVDRVTYDSLKRKTATENQNTGTTAYTFHDSGKVSTVTDANGNITTYAYDDLNRVISVDYPAGTNDAVVTYGAPGTAVSNGVGRITEVSLVDDLSTNNLFMENTLSYNSKGKTAVKTTTIDSKTFIISRLYDSLDRVQQVTYPDGKAITREYGESGYLNNVTWNGHSIIKYGALEENGAGEVTDYDNTIYRVTGNNIKTTITYDPLTRHALSIVSLNTETGTEVENVSFGYDATTENITSITEAFNDNGTIRNSNQAFTYDSLNRLTTADGTYGSISYSYTTGGNLTQKGDVTLTYEGNSHKVVSDSLGNSYSYDANGNMTGRKGKTLNYDAKNRLVSIYNGTTAEALYYYDYNGHRIKHSRTNSEGNVLVTYNIDSLYEVTEDQSGTRAAHHTKFFYGIENELAAQATALDSELVAMHTPAISRNYYNLATVKGLFMFGYRSFEHHILKHDAHVKLVQGMMALMLAGLLLLVIVNMFLSKERRFIAAGLASRFSTALLFVIISVFGLTGCELPFGSIIGDAPWMSTEYAYPDPIPSNGLPEQGMYFFHPDYTGNISYVTDSAGAVVNKLYYKPYGETFNQTGSDVHRHKFNSHQYDGDETAGGSGLMYYKARYYDPVIGRFLSADRFIPDPMKSQTLNRYAYVEGNPIELSDPSGHSAWSWFKKAVDTVTNKASEIFNKKVREIIGDSVHSFIRAINNTIVKPVTDAVNDAHDFLKSTVASGEWWGDQWDTWLKDTLAIVVIVGLVVLAAYISPIVVICTITGAVLGGTKMGQSSNWSWEHAAFGALVGFAIGCYGQYVLKPGSQLLKSNTAWIDAIGSFIYNKVGVGTGNYAFYGKCGAIFFGIALGLQVGKDPNEKKEDDLEDDDNVEVTGGGTTF